MLSLFVRALVMIWAICCLILAAILAKAQPLTAFETGFALCSVPCWAGVEPGRTAIDQVPELINSHLSDVTVAFAANTVEVSAPSLHVDGFIQAAPGEPVRMIRLNAVHPLWQLLLALDVPACIQFLDSEIITGTANIFWEINGVYIFTNVFIGGSSDETLATTLNLWAAPPAFPCDDSINTIPWPGFAALMRQPIR
jgi:hypothetical protein